MPLAGPQEEQLFKRPSPLFPHTSNLQAAYFDGRIIVDIDIYFMQILTHMALFLTPQKAQSSNLNRKLFVKQIMLIHKTTLTATDNNI